MVDFGPIYNGVTTLQPSGAAWSDFKEFKSKGIKTQWRAEKLFVKKGEHFVGHKVLSL